MTKTIQNTITGPCLPDLQTLYNTSFDQIAYVNTVSVGALCSNVNKQIAYMMCLMIIGITTSLYTYAKTLSFLFCGGIDSFINVWIVEMWGQNCGPFVQGLQFVLGVGSLTTPVIVNPFLSQPVTVYEYLNTTSNQTLPTNGLSAYMIALANDILLNWNNYWTSFAGSYGLELDNNLANDILTAMLAFPMFYL
ncbi:unnamed protein product [Oppiella nova]|uniref:Uncharacterized protein n=1 Tax=Oppiella nova TaxID=334625 RepID=A0A7R9LGR0_9ACAR|nr:unnamed protein product [Oppiella nova]CAG2163522.1 unnamed protein product [Oppiella nova]